MKLFIENFLISYCADVPLALLIGYLLDLLIGDPHGMWHPIRFIGNMISLFEKEIRKVFPKTARGEFVGGVCLVVLVLICAAGIPFAVLMLGYWIHRVVGFALQCYMCFTILATKSLKTESMKVYDALKKDGLPAGRHAVSMIVGRDTENLTETGVTKAAVETIAENTSDGVIAPMIFLAIGGPVLGYFYKGVNTMDSMVGYKNEKYAHFGTAAARLDDFLNFLPSRIAALLMILACFLMPERKPSEAKGRGTLFIAEKKNVGDGNFDKENLKKEQDDIYTISAPSAKNALRIWRRDRRKHASPNSAQTESVMAGALSVELAGDAWYFGVRHEKPTIGDALRPIEIEDIVRANRILYGTSAAGLLLCFGLRVLFQLL